MYLHSELAAPCKKAKPQCNVMHQPNDLVPSTVVRGPLYTACVQPAWSSAQIHYPEIPMTSLSSLSSLIPTPPCPNLSQDPTEVEGLNSLSHKNLSSRKNQKSVFGKAFYQKSNAKFRESVFPKTDLWVDFREDVFLCIDTNSLLDLLL